MNYTDLLEKYGRGEFDIEELDRISFGDIKRLLKEGDMYKEKVQSINKENSVKHYSLMMYLEIEKGKKSFEKKLDELKSC